jgi:hypothetical protein
VRKGEQRTLYWVMYEERAQVKVTTWPEPERWDWGLRTTQHFGTESLATAKAACADLQQHVNNKTHFLYGDCSGPEGHHLTEAWIEVEHRCRFDPAAPLIPTITLADSAGAIEANPAAENSQEA